jgi:O-antigen ligase
VVMSRAQAFQRLWLPDPAEETRLATLSPVLDLVWRYFPVGSGAGSFAEVYQVAEPDVLLGPTYLNHAHNDWLETVMTLGLPGALLLIAGLAAFAAGARRAWAGADMADPLRRLGTAMVLILGIASIGDYPLRTPILAAIFALGCVWMSLRTRAAADKSAGV